MFASQVQNHQPEIVEKQENIDIAASKDDDRRVVPLVPVNYFESVEKPED